MKRKSLVLLMIVALVASVFVPGLLTSKVDAAGEVIEISNMVELNNIRNNTSGHYVLVNDIDLQGYNWTPIPNFSGIFDGNGKTIRNLTVNAPTTDNVGLFSQILSGGEVKNLTLENARANGKGYVGALAGQNYGNITNVGVEGGEVTGQSTVGGLVGYNYSYGTIQQAYVTGKVTGQSSVGGLVGVNNKGTIQQAYASGDVTGQGNIVGGLVANNSGTIQNAYATGDITGQGQSVGGLVGSNSGTIQQVYATGDVTGQTQVGGLIGVQSSGKTENAFALNGKVEGTSNVGKAIGNKSGGTVTNLYAPSHATGIAQYVTHLLTPEQVFDQATYQTTSFDFTSVWVMDAEKNLPVLQFHPVTVEKVPTLTDKPYLTMQDGKLFNIIYTPADLQRVSIVPSANYLLANDLNLDGYNWTPLSAFSGILDGNGKTIRNMTINASTTDYVGLFSQIASGGEVKNLTLENARVNGKNRVGALAGQNNGKIINVGMEGGEVTGQGQYVGGLVGLNNSGSTIRQAYATGNVTGQSTVGGLAGGNNGTIRQAYTTGNVTGQSIAVGGLAGGNAGIIQNAYAMGDVTGQERVGGLAGFNGAIIQQAYATGNMLGQTYVGGLVGYVHSGKIENAFALNGKVAGTTNVGKTIGYRVSGTVSNLTAITTMSGGHNNYVSNTIIPEQALQMVTYTTTNFDFNTPIWGIDEGKTLPYLVFAPYKVGYDPGSGNWVYPDAGIQPQPEEPTAPSVPPVVEPSTDGTSLTVRWTDPEHPDFSGVHLYIRPIDGEYGAPVFVPPGVEQYTFTGLTPGVTYVVKYSFLYGDTELPGPEVEVTMPGGGTQEPGNGEPGDGDNNGQNPGGGDDEQPTDPVKPDPVVTPGEGQLLVEWTYPDDDRIVGAKVTLFHEGAIVQGPVTVNRPQNSYLFTGVNSDKTYTVRVVFVYDDGTVSEPGEETGAPEPAEPTDPGEPPAPGEPPVTEPSADGKSLTVTWVDPDHPDFTGVHVYIRPLDGAYGAPVFVAPGVERYTFTGLTPGVDYAVKIAFLFFGDIEVPGEETEVTMPGGGTQEPGQGQDPGDEGGSGPGNGGTDPGQNPGDDEQPADPEPITLRSPVLKLVDNSRDGVTLEANEVENGQVYILKRKTGSEGYVEVARQDATGTGKVTFTDTAFALKTTYSYVVEVQNGNAKAESNKVTVTTPLPEDEMPFSETPGLKVTAKTASSITLEGTPIERATEYILYRKQADGSFAEIARKSAGEALIFVDTGLQEKTTYTYRLAATNGKVSAQSPLVSATTEALPPETPIIVTARLVGVEEQQSMLSQFIAGILNFLNINSSEETDKTAIEVEWTDPSVKPQAYVVYRQEGDGALKQVKTILHGQDTLYRDEQVEEGKTYTYYVEALKDGMTSDRAASNPVTVPVSEQNKRGWDENPLMVEQIGPNQVKVSWVPAGGQPDKYFLYRIDTANPIYKQSIAVLSGDVTEYVDNKVKKGKTYIYVIKAVYRDGPNNEHTDEYASEPITIE